MDKITTPQRVDSAAVAAAKAQLPAIKHLALVAHDHCKEDLIEWASFNVGTLSRHHLYATGTTGGLLQSRLGLPVQRFLSGPLGGDQQIGAWIAEGKLDGLIFFWDPLTAQPHDPDVKALIRLATVYNIPVALNRATADFLISSPLMAGTYERILPDFKARLGR
jgi:methylglyoxal synthase